MKKKLPAIITILILATLVSGCLTDSVKLKKEPLEDDDQQKAMEHNQCVSYGFPPNTIEYTNCRMKLDQQRIENTYQEKPQNQSSQKHFITLSQDKIKELDQQQEKEKRQHPLVETSKSYMSRDEISRKQRNQPPSHPHTPR